MRAPETNRAFKQGEAENGEPETNHWGGARNRRGCTQGAASKSRTRAWESMSEGTQLPAKQLDTKKPRRHRPPGSRVKSIAAEALGRKLAPQVGANMAF